MEKLTPTKEVFNKIKELDEQLDKLYKERDELVTSIVTIYGTGEYVIYNESNTEKPYLRMAVVDNIVELNQGKTLWKSTGFKRYGVYLKELKHQPKEK